MFCPKCKSEYLGHVSKCPDCEIYLVDRLDAEETGGQRSHSTCHDGVELVKILHTYSPNDIIMLKSVLDAAGVTYFIQGENLNHVRPAAEPAILLVAREQEDEVRELLKDMNLGYFIVSSIKTKNDKRQK